MDLRIVVGRGTFFLEMVTEYEQQISGMDYKYLTSDR